MSHEYVETVGNYVVTFKVKENSIVSMVYDKETGDVVIGYQHFSKDPTPILKDPELRRLLAEATIKVLGFFRKYHPIIGSVIAVEFKQQ
jgi:DNA repair protein RadC